ncbi:acyltransferase family protein [Alteromonas sp. 14N.309.X.WAT.G.H12]|uniref:acyltransferase family protein n=1 Tax=Alteromonas sp. 14N.309.X.WAT.G.H12 TaxID=3120824 RepID=UPI002FD1BB59
MKRVMAVDVMRGLAIVLMVLVNNPGSWQSVYWPLLHAKWHGLTPTDLVFPFFIFIMGVAMNFAFAHQRMQQQPPKAIVLSIIKRSAILFALGLFLALFYVNTLDPNFSWIEDKLLSIRVMGVLQRLAVVYFVTAFILYKLDIKGQYAALVVCIGGYWMAMAWLPYHDSQDQVYVGLWEFGNSFSAWIDNAVLGANHVYYPQAQPFPFDPEGLLSTFPAIGTCLFGVIAGQWLVSGQSEKNTCGLLFVSGVVLLVGGLILSLWVPVNKGLWSPSYTVLTAGLAMLLLGVLVFILDIKHHQLWAKPFVVAGANSIVFFMLSGILARIFLMIPVAGVTLKAWLFQQVFSPLASPQTASLLFACCFLLLCYLPVYVMYRKKWFLRV